MTLTEATHNDLARSPERMATGLRGVLSMPSVVRENEPLAKRTTLRVGGPADVWVEPADENDLSSVLAFTAEHGLPVMILGRGSNLLVRDGGIRGVVISLSQPYFSNVRVEGDHLRCGAGARLKAVAIEARKQGLAGLEFLEGIPGSVGGALRMNAGAHGGSAFGVVMEVRLLDSRGNMQVVAGNEMEAVYRSCPMLKTHVAIEAVLSARSDEPERIEQRMREFNTKRWASQPAAPSAGCIFKNPESIPAGKLVEELGLKGARVGGAMVSLEHGNFIVTDGHARSVDVLELIEEIRQQARNKRGVDLQTEVQIVGEEVRA
jgi:UDP-N-acetylenolpyruvoylglucosamine reductase